MPNGAAPRTPDISAELLRRTQAQERTARDRDRQGFGVAEESSPTIGRADQPGRPRREARGPESSQADRPEPEGAEESPDEAQRKATLRERLQRRVVASQERRREQQRSADESQEGPSTFQGRDMYNAQIDRLAYGSLIASLGLDPFSLAWFNLKLFYGKIIKKGQSRVIASPSFQSMGIPLPSIYADTSILVIDGIWLAVLIPILLILFIFAVLIVYAATEPCKAIIEFGALLGDGGALQNATMKAASTFCAVQAAAEAAIN